MRLYRQEQKLGAERANLVLHFALNEELFRVLVAPVAVLSVRSHDCLASENLDISVAPLLQPEGEGGTLIDCANFAGERNGVALNLKLMPLSVLELEMR